MKETKKENHEIVEDMLSKDANRIWVGSCAICSLSQNRTRIKELIPYRTRFETAACGIDLGGMLAPNSRFLDKALEIIEFHKSSKECPCVLRMDTDFFNPKHLQEDGYIEILDKVYYKDSNYVDYYMVRCIDCNAKYKVYEEVGHMACWRWIKI